MARFMGNLSHFVRWKIGGVCDSLRAFSLSVLALMALRVLWVGRVAGHGPALRVGAVIGGPSGGVARVVLIAKTGFLAAGGIRAYRDWIA